MHFISLKGAISELTFASQHKRGHETRNVKGFHGGTRLHSLLLDVVNPFDFLFCSLPTNTGYNWSVRYQPHRGKKFQHLLLSFYLHSSQQCWFVSYRWELKTLNIIKSLNKWMISESLIHLVQSQLSKAAISALSWAFSRFTLSQKIPNNTSPTHQVIQLSTPVRQRREETDSKCAFVKVIICLCHRSDWIW